ncbi:Hsp20 family protein [Frigidibacter sp. ROC022]|uniref:Hsp20 family protein n=1 Tax=Frigidibacter sp. ROC022 TaxID=2971796 RepID=UPI00215AAE16|nr:Hsp20 family protein [Frigidibacter sp. ROC022]MCR8722738.1 Hsp20 family protein [Frigidibacter sp. ROC022]
MRTFDLAPLYRATVGFDQVANLMDRVLSNDVGNQSYPPYNIEKTGEDAWRISVAVAGFSPEELTVEQRENALVISARKSEEKSGKEAEGERVWLHRGIANRAFERRFTLADHVNVTGASHEHGLLNVDLVRQVPEALKPRRIAIAGPKSTGETVEAEAVEEAASVN